ncbi:MAG: metallophosphoesterase [Ruminococcus sp.]|jgi:predicted phosphohydrolase|nr:metallophosphoesterase [Ruminococcus sp.]
MNLWAIADLHLPFSADKSHDIFEGFENYTEKIEKNFKTFVKRDDTVVIPGDISWAENLKSSAPDFLFLDSLPGIKIISKGNHDRWWAGTTKINAFFAEHGIHSIKIVNNNHYTFGKYGICATRGWDFLGETEHDEKLIRREAMRLENSVLSAVNEGLQPIVFLHYPPITINGRIPEFFEIFKKYGVKKVYYGHLHGKKAHAMAFLGERAGIDFDLVSSDFVQFCPKIILQNM